MVKIKQIKWIFYVISLCLLASCTVGKVAQRPLSPLDRIFANGEETYRNGEYRYAVRAYQSFMISGADDPRLPLAHLRLGQALYALDDLQQSRYHLDQIRTDYPLSEHVEEAELLIAQINYKEGDIDGALAIFRTLTREARNHHIVAAAHLLRGKIFLESGDHALAFSQWKKALLVQGEQEGILPLYEEMAETLDGSFSGDDLEQMMLDSQSLFSGDLALFVSAKRALESGERVHASQLFEKFMALFQGHPLRSRVEYLMGEERTAESMTFVRLGVILPLSGRLQGVGRQVLQGVELSVGGLNAMFLEKKVELVVRDSAGDPLQARSAMEEFARDPSMVAVIGPAVSRCVIESSMIAEDAHLPVITPTASAEGIGGLGQYIFRNAMTNEAQAVTMAHYAVERLDVLNLVVLYPEDFYGKELSDFFIQEFTALGGTVLHAASYPKGALDYGPQIRSIIEKDLSTTPRVYTDTDLLQDQTKDDLLKNYSPSFEAVYLPGYSEDVGLLIPQLAYYNIESVHLLGSHNWNSIELIRRGERYVEGAVYTDGFLVDSPHTDIAEFVASYRQAYGEEPTLFSAQAYDAAEMILQSLYKGARSREDLQRRLMGIKNFPGVSGLTSTLSTGDMQKELFLIRIEEGRFRQVN